jgi:NadR type nicotinamide-nucleotide adenylyltransferase
MVARYRAGLVVGKFSPLHLGHEWLIRQAQAQCQTIFLLTYSVPELPGCAAERREAWLAARFPELAHWPARVEHWRREGLRLPELPHNDAPEAEQRQFVAEFCRQIIGTTVDAVFTSEAYGDGFAAHLANHFGHPVAHILVDRARRHVPISASRLRDDIHGSREFLAPEVYGDFVERICLLGGESTGKSTLAEALAEVLDTAWVAEFGREHWTNRGGRLEFDDLLHIGRVQVRREMAAAQRAVHYLVCDTSPLTTLFYSRHLFDRVAPELERLAERPYRHLFLCDDDFPFVQDGTRQGEVFRRHQQAWYRTELARRGWSFTLLSGTLEQRVQQVLATLGEDGRAP